MDQQPEQQPQGARSLPVRRTETSLIKDEFDSLRARFDAEMRQMEEDMARFRSQMQSSFSSSKHFSSKTSTRSSSKTNKDNISTSTTTSNTSSTKGAPTIGEQQLGEAQGRAASPLRSQDDWLEEFANSPMVVNSPGGGHEKLLKLRFDVSAYEPDKIVVVTSDDRLKVCAKREVTSDHKCVSSEYNREFLLPDNVDHDQIKSTLSADGILTVEVPLTARAN